MWLLARMAGFEPTSPDLESGAQPLYHILMAWMAGLEPATLALTMRCSTIELHPIKLEIRMGIEPMYTVLQTDPSPLGHRIENHFIAFSPSA